MAQIAGVLTAVGLIVLALWWHAATIRRWERETDLFNAWSGCDMTVDEYRAWMTRHQKR